MEEIIEHLPETLRALRKGREWSQKQLAERIGVSTAYVNHLEKGNRNPSLKTFFKLAEIFEIDPAKLLNGKVNSKKKRDGGK